jgi:predicted ATP-dependent protease
MKMTKKFDKLNEVFNIADDIMSSEVKDVDIVIDNVRSNETDIQKDYQYSRANMYSIIEKGQEAINDVLELAQETESARAYEVVGQLIKNVSDATEKLIDLQKKLRDIEDPKKSNSPTNVTNALFFGSTAELSKLLKANRELKDS